MGWVEALIVYLLVWWVTLFAVLPWGVITQSDEGRVEAGTDPSAPARAKFGRKLLITTGTAFVLWLIVMAVIQMDLIQVRQSG